MTNQNPKSTSKELAFAALVAAIVFLAFIPALGNDFVDYDDTDNFLRNENYRGLGAEQLAWMWTPRVPFFMGHYHPLTWMTLGLDWVLWKDDAHGYHLTSNLIHSINAALVFLIALRLLTLRNPEKPLPAPSPSGKGGLLIAAFAALAWGLHPLRVESVAWITERRDLVNGFFALLAVMAYLKMNRHERELSKRRAWLAITLALFVCSLLGKVMTVTLPAVLLVMDWYPLRRLTLLRFWSDARSRAAVMEKIPFFLITALFIWMGAKGQAGGGWLLSWEQHGLLPRVAVTCFGLVFYLLKTIWPFTLLPIYEIHLPINPFEWRFLISGVLVIALAALALALRRRMPGFAAALACYAIILSPVIGLVQNGNQIAADRYAYLAMIPMMIALGGGASRLRLRAGNRAAGGGLAAVAAAVVLVLIGWLTWRQCLIWRSTESLWSHVANNDPGSSYGQNSYGFVLMEKGWLDEAIPYFRRAIGINPGNERAHVNLWDALGRKGDLAGVEAAAQSALGNPIAAPFAHYKLGNLRLAAPAPDPATRRRLTDEARAHFEATIKARPIDAAAHNDLAIALQRLDRTDEAISHFRIAIELRPSLPNPRYGLAISLQKSGKRDEAIAALRELLAIQPDHAAGKTLLRQLENQ